MTDYDILVPGNYFCDLIFTGFPRFPALGSEVYTEGLTITVGGALNTVIALHRLGVRVGWAGCVGTDLFSRYVLDVVESEGVDTSLLTRVAGPFQRVTVSVSYPHDRAFITHVDPAPTPTQLAFDIQGRVSFKHLHFTGFHLDARTLALFERMHQRGITISMDCQDRPITLETDNVRAAIAALQIFMPNAKEARQLASTDELDAAAEKLRALVPTLVIKDGANGAYAWQGGARLHAAPIAVKAVDTTGAGDVFNAGFLAAYLAGKPLADCLTWGSICGGLSTTASGGTAAAPRRADVEAWIAAR